jgi:hypothetical protein
MPKTESIATTTRRGRKAAAPTQAELRKAIRLGLKLMERHRREADRLRSMVLEYIEAYGRTYPAMA